MALDFAPDWIESAAEMTRGNAALLSSLQDNHYSPRHPDGHELADLVHELYMEGTLTYQELRTLSHMPELRTHLLGTLETIDPSHRLQGAAQ